jgi:hypothetical protein
MNEVAHLGRLAW